MEFVQLGLSQPLLRALSEANHVTATPIQAQAIPQALAGRDLLGCAQTGTGKTAAFALPILQRLATAGGDKNSRRARCLVLCPTRELAVQIQASFRTYGRYLPLRSVAIYGGVNQWPQVTALRQGTEILVTTPGRLMDLMEQGHADLSGIETLVLDEADRMLDMGFIHDIRRIVSAIPRQRQTLLFSATLSSTIRTLAATLLHDPVAVQVAKTGALAERVKQSVYFVERKQKTALLVKLVDDLNMKRVIVFTRTRHGADRVARQVHQSGVRAEAIHAGKTQRARQHALENFRANRTPVLVATDIAARGIDVADITHVVNYDLTADPEAYVHRIGRTARAGALGEAVSFCDREEVPNLRAVEKLTRERVPVMTLPSLSSLPVLPSLPAAPSLPNRQPRRAFAGHAPARPVQSKWKGRRNGHHSVAITHPMSSSTPAPSTNARTRTGAPARGRRRRGRGV